MVLASLVSHYQPVKRQTTSNTRQAGNMLPADPNRVLAENVERLIEGLSHRPPRPELASRMGIGDKTLGFLKAGTGNPTLESITKVARFFRVEPWTLLRPEDQPEPSSSPLDASLLTKCLTHAIALFREERRLPTDQQIATVASALYEGATQLGDFAAAESQARQALERIARDQRSPHHAR